MQTDRWHYGSICNGITTTCQKYTQESQDNISKISGVAYVCILRVDAPLLPCDVDNSLENKGEDVLHYCILQACKEKIS